MKKVLVAVFAVGLMLSVSDLFADNIGCGLGRLALKGQKGKVFEIVGMTLNAIGTQTFAVTTGTSGYKEGAVIGVNYVNAYVAQNMDNLATDIAKGDGEYLNTLATLMKVENKDSFKEALNRNFNKIYTSKDVTSDEVVENINKITNS
jgi:hypothetical protein